MAKADIRFSDDPAMLARKKQVGAWLDTARHALNWNIDQLAEALHKDASQVRRWLDGTDRVQLDAVLAVSALYREFLIAQARDNSACEVVTEIRVRRLA